jgi:Ca2+-transporting ATPase
MSRAGDDPLRLAFPGEIVSESNRNTSGLPTKGTQATPTVLDLGGLVGLGERDAGARLQQEGPNELPAQKRRSLLTIGFEVAREPMFLMLVAAGALYLFMGEPVDALRLLGFVFVVMGITLGAGLVCVLWFELVKLARRHKGDRARA